MQRKGEKIIGDRNKQTKAKQRPKAAVKSSPTPQHDDENNEGIITVREEVHHVHRKEGDGGQAAPPQEENEKKENPQLDALTRPDLQSKI